VKAHAKALQFGVTFALLDHGELLEEDSDVGWRNADSAILDHEFEPFRVVVIRQLDCHADIF